MNSVNMLTQRYININIVIRQYNVHYNNVVNNIVNDILKCRSISKPLKVFCLSYC